MTSEIAMSGGSGIPLQRVSVTLDQSVTWIPSTTDVLTYTTMEIGGTETDDQSNFTSACAGTVHDIELDKSYRLLILFLTVGLCIVGSVLVILWMLCNRRLSPKFNHLSRVNAFILNLTFADVLVILLAVLPQLVWEYVDRQWAAGDVMCRLVKFLQSFSMMSSNYMLVVIAIDRHQAIRAPLKESISVSTHAKHYLSSLPIFSLHDLLLCITNVYLSPSLSEFSHLLL